MLSTPFTHPIFLPVPESDPRHRIEIALLALATIYVLFAQIDAAARLGLQVWALLAWCWCFGKERRWLGIQGASRAVWQPGSGWSVAFADGTEYPAEVRAATRVFVRFIVLSLHIKELGSFGLIVWPGLIKHNAQRRLRVVLRLGNG